MAKFLYFMWLNFKVIIYYRKRVTYLKEDPGNEFMIFLGLW